MSICCDIVTKQKTNSACHLTVAQERSDIMYELVEMRENDIFTTSKIIAEGTNNKHNSITAIIQKYEEDFKEFGSVRFVDLKSKNLQGGRPEKIYYLNEEQATLLMTYLLHENYIEAAGVVIFHL